MNLFAQPRLLTAAGIYLVVSLVCTQIPLLNYLGYEFSLLVAFLASAISGLLTISLLKEELAKASAPSREVVRQSVVVFRQALLINLTLLVFPLVVMGTNALFVKNCSMFEGLSFFVLLPVVSVWFTSTLGFFCAAGCRFPRTIFFLFFATTLVYALVLGYFTSAIYSFNFFYGYFPGLTYDEVLVLSWPVLAFRVFTVLVGGLFLWMALLIVGSASTVDPVRVRAIILMKMLTQPKRRLLSGSIIIIFILLYTYRGLLGFESPSGFIQRALGGKFETDNFTIFYPKDFYSDQEIHWVGVEHEFRLHQILEVLKLPFHRKIESYIYPSVETKRRLIGAGITNIAKPWSGEIHLTKETLYRTLKHELFHVLAAPFGLPVIKASLSTGLVEGLAMAIEWDWGNRTLHQYAAGMRKFGVAPDIRRLMTLTGFAAQSSSVSYVLAGSFCRFLMDKYGVRRIMLLYKTADYDRLYGHSLEALIAEWQSFLDQIPLDQQDADMIDVFFRRPPIFQKICARVIADRNNEAMKNLAEKNYASAGQLYWKSYTEGKGYSALTGYLVSEQRQRRYSSLIAALDTIIMRQEYPGMYLPLFITIGDAYWGEKEFGRALDLYLRVECADLSEAYTEAAILRSIVVKDPSIRENLFKYFLSDANDTLRLAMLDTISQAHRGNWIPMYMKGKMFYSLGRFDDSFRLLSTLDLPESNKHLEAIRLKTVGKALFRMQRFQEAKVSFWLSLNSVSTEVAMNEINDWLERCEWFGQHTFP